MSKPTTYACPSSATIGIPVHSIDAQYCDEYRCGSCRQMLGEPLSALIWDHGGLKEYQKHARSHGKQLNEPPHKELNKPWPS